MFSICKLTSLVLFLVIKRANFMEFVTTLVLCFVEVLPPLSFLCANFPEIACILSHGNLDISYLHRSTLAGIARVCLAVIAALHVRIWICRSVLGQRRVELSCMNSALRLHSIRALRLATHDIVQLHLRMVVKILVIKASSSLFKCFSRYS